MARKLSSIRSPDLASRCMLLSVPNDYPKTVTCPNNMILGHKYDISLFLLYFFREKVQKFCICLGLHMKIKRLEPLSTWIHYLTLFVVEYDCLNLYSSISLRSLGKGKEYLQPFIIYPILSRFS